MDSIVYIPQMITRWDHESGRYVHRFDTSAAESYGVVEFLLSPTAHINHSGSSIIPELNKKLAQFSDQDYLVIAGGPTIVSVCLSIASYFNMGRIRILQWNRREGAYDPISLDLNRLE